MNYTKELTENINKALDYLATVDFDSNDHRILNSNREKVHKAYDTLFKARDILLYSIKSKGGTNE